MMDAAGGGRFEAIAADRAVNQRPDMSPIETRREQGLFGRLDALFARPHRRRPKSPLGDARHQFEPALGQPEPLVERRQLGLDLRRRDDFLRQRVRDRFKTNVFVTHGNY